MEVATATPEFPVAVVGTKRKASGSRPVSYGSGTVSLDKSGYGVRRRRCDLSIRTP